MSKGFRTERSKITASKDPREGEQRSPLFRGDATLFRYIDPGNVLANKIAHRHAVKVTTMSEEIWRRTRRGT
ncbi:unnamed protein product [Lasius platythorax]|uniref:Uncharacterized protein n=1 Tax=Lasius platythorax TaxID=488582 RepID=A0AAV2NMP1_9HYME